MKTTASLGLALLLLFSSAAHAWWNADWPFRKKVMFDTTPAGADIGRNLAATTVLVRLHTGNMAFIDLKQDGSDLRFVTADDKLPLKHHIEFFDPINELALVWVQVPVLTGGTNAESIWMYFGNPDAALAEDARGSYDPSHTGVFHFSGAPGDPAAGDPAAGGTAIRDATIHENNATHTGVTRIADGIIGPAARFDGNARMVVPVSPSLQLAPGGGFTFSAWVKGSGGTLLERRDGGGELTLALRAGVLEARLGGDVVASSAQAPAADRWHHIGVTVADRLVVYLDGIEVAAAPAPATTLGGELVIGAGFNGDMDEVQLASVARDADWFKATAAGQGADARLVSYGEDEQTGSSGDSYMGILLGAVTLDGWVVIAILMVMAVISWFVMLGKGVFVARAESANRAFLEQFQRFGGDVLALDRMESPQGTAAASTLGNSPLNRLYRLGVKELRTRFDKHQGTDADLYLKPQAIDAIRATLDAGMVRENHRLNSQMVLLTIAISGGPFLGLLGTVVGVMITFAAIAAAGDVNVNSIAPGIAAALVATVAGLAVAIPALFGYNYLASKTKNISADMQVFADEFVTKLAENYSG